MPLVTDQMGRSVEVPQKPHRIISLVPSQTELLAHLGLNEEVVGVTKFCIHPKEWTATKTKIGGTKNANIAAIKSLQLDLIIANKEENVKEQVEELAKHFPVWVSDVNTLQDAYEMMELIGVITGKEIEASILVEKIRSSFAQLQTINYKPQTCTYLIWKDPYMTIGGDTFIHQMLAQTGFDNLFKNAVRYPVVTIGQLQRANCQLLFLSSEPYPFKQKHIDELRKQLPQTKIILVDGELFSWYGSRLLYAPAYFQLLHQQLLSKP